MLLIGTAFCAAPALAETTRIDLGAIKAPGVRSTCSCRRPSEEMPC